MKLLPEERKRAYFRSVTEEEIRHGIMLADDVTRSALCYIRELDGIKNCVTDKLAKKFVDLEGDKIDTVSQSLREDLARDKLPKKLHDGKMREYSTPWTGKPLEISSEKTHEAYLEKFCQDFVTDMKELITKSVQRASENKDLDNNALCLEVLHHAHFANTKCETFCGQSDVLDFARKHLSSDRREHCPITIHGQSGFGKTSVMAYIAKKVNGWLNKKCTVAMRFLGTSPDSSSIKSTLLSLIQQVSYAYEEQQPSEDELQNMGDIRRHFWSLLHKIDAKTVSKPLVLVLDSVDQLSQMYQAQRMLWLPKTIPRNVHIILSMLSDRYDCLNYTQERFPGEENYFQLQALSPETCKDIVDVFMSKHGRCLNSEQRKVLDSAFATCPQPLYLKLSLDAALLWKSYTPPESVFLATTVHEAIDHLFLTAEDQHGRVFVRHALGYLTIGKEGLTNIELEDALSCDNDVLNDIYVYHDPPLEGIIRIPSLLWARLQYNIKEYITERKADGKVVMAWYHRQFWEAAERRYLSDPNVVRSYHSSLGELFLQEYGIRKTITLTKRGNREFPDADRQVTFQPLTPRNLRKLNVLPYHLLHASQTDTLKTECLLNFKWILTKLLAVGVNAVLAEYAQILQHDVMEKDLEVNMMHDCLLLCYDALKDDPYQLAYQVGERLLASALKNAAAEQICKDAAAWITKTDRPLLLPTHRMHLQDLASPLKYTLMAGYDGQLSADGDTIACHWQEMNWKGNKVQLWKIQSKDLVASVETKQGALYRMTSDGKQLVVSDNEYIRMYDTESGDMTKEFRYREETFDKIDCRALATNRTAHWAVIGVKFGQQKKNKAWKYISHLFSVNTETMQMENQILFTPNKNDKHIDKLFIIDSLNEVIALTYDRITILSLPDLQQRHFLSDIRDIRPDTFTLSGMNDPLLIGGYGGQNAGQGRVCVIDIKNRTIEESEPVHISSGDKGWPFAVVVSTDTNLIAVGTCEDGKQRNNGFCLWDRTGKFYTKVQLAVHDGKLPRALAMIDSWKIAAVGWEGGNISLVHVANGQEPVLFKAHDRGVVFMSITHNGNLATMAWDHALKVWDADKLCVSVSESDKTASPNALTTKAGKQISPDEQCIAIATAGQFAVTAPPESNNGARLWNLADGFSVEPLTQELDLQYKEVYSKMSKFPTKKAGEFRLMCRESLLMDLRKTRNTYSVHIIDHVTGRVVRQEMCEPCYRILKRDDDHVILFKDGIIEIKNVQSWATLKSINIPPLAEELKQAPPRAYVTVDSRYLLLVNAFPPKKYFDLIDLNAGIFMSTTTLPEETSSELLEDGYYFLTFEPGEEPSILKPEELHLGHYLKTVVIQSGWFLSVDFRYGFQYCPDHSVSVMDVMSNTLLHSLVGHVHKVQTAMFTRDTKYVVTGSFDATVRLWSMRNGHQLCMFRTSGAVDRVLFSPAEKHLAVHCYAAPKRKRLVILALLNLEA